MLHYITAGSFGSGGEGEGFYIRLWCGGRRMRSDRHSFPSNSCDALWKTGPGLYTWLMRKPWWSNPRHGLTPVTRCFTGVSLPHPLKPSSQIDRLTELIYMTSGYSWRSDTIRPCPARPCPTRAQPARALSMLSPVPSPACDHAQSMPRPALARARAQSVPIPVPSPCPTRPFPSPIADWHRSPAASPTSPSRTPQNPRHRLTDVVN
jgi:hypothetical protein